MARDYLMRKRADARDRTRERILAATMQLHDEQGVAGTTFSDIARRAGVGPATVSRHFPGIGDLVAACGVHVWQDMRPPEPQSASAVYEGVSGLPARLSRLVAELDAFYRRGSHRLPLAQRDRHIIPQLDGFLQAVEAGVEALVREALDGSGYRERAVQVAIGLSGFATWSAMQGRQTPPEAMRLLWASILQCGLKATPRSDALGNN